jgi:hypothetical protein
LLCQGGLAGSFNRHKSYSVSVDCWHFCFWDVSCACRRLRHWGDTLSVIEEAMAKTYFFFLILTSFYPLIVGVEVYCCPWSYSVTLTHTHSYTHTHTHTHTHTLTHTHTHTHSHLHTHTHSLTRQHTHTHTLTLTHTTHTLTQTHPHTHSHTHTHTHTHRLTHTLSSLTWYGRTNVVNFTSSDKTADKIQIKWLFYCTYDVTLKFLP